MKSPEEVTLGDALELAGRLSYKPGTQFSAHLVRRHDLGVPNVIMLRLRYFGPSSNGGDIELFFQRPLASGYLLEEFKELVYFFEEHERHEWLKLDGKRLVEPHPELRTPAAAPAEP